MEKLNELVVDVADRFAPADSEKQMMILRNYLRNFGRKMGQEDWEVIDEALRRGGKRAPKKTEVFVHVAWPDRQVSLLENRFGYSREGAVHVIAKFKKSIIAEIERVLDEGNTPVFCIYQDEFEESQDPNVVIDSPVPYEKGLCFQTVPLIYAGETGFLSREAMARFTSSIDGVNPEDEFVVHGAEFASCVANFAVQTAMVKRGFLVTDTEFCSNGKEQSHYRMQMVGQKLSNAYKTLAAGIIKSGGGILSDSGVSFGTVFDSNVAFIRTVLDIGADYQDKASVQFLSAGTSLHPGIEAQERHFAFLHEGVVSRQMAKFQQALGISSEDFDRMIGREVSITAQTQGRL